MYFGRILWSPFILQSSSLFRYFSSMKRLLDYPLSVLYGLWFLLTLLIFHPLQMFAYHLFGKRAHQRVVHALNFFLLHGLYLLGTRLSFSRVQATPTDRPIIFVANHQSMFDIIGMIWYLRANFPVFVSKKELAKGIPSISYNLQKSGAALIDRKDSRQAIAEIVRLAKMIEESNFSACIFPEGTRSLKGMKRFSAGGLGALIKKAPSALVVPVAINGTGKLDSYKSFPFRSFQQLSWKTLTPIEPKGKTPEEMAQLAEDQIRAEVEGMHCTA